MQIVFVSILRFGVLLALAGATFAQQPAAQQDAIARDGVRQYFKMLEALNSKYQGRDLFWELEDAFGTKPAYTAKQVLFILDPHSFDQKVEVPATIPATRSASVPFGAFSAQEVEKYIDVLTRQDAALNKPAVDRKGALIRKFGKQPWYRADEIREIEKNPDKATIQGTVPTADTAALQAEKDKQTARHPILNGLSGFKIRKNWSDVVASEDPSQVGTTKKTMDDLEGASFSYSHDDKAKPYKGSTVADTWSAVGSLIYPITWTGTAEFGSWAPAYVMLAPSVSVNKIATQNPTNEVDHLEYRMGVVGSWVVADKWLSEIQVRGAFVYDTDTGHHASLPAGELDIEPRFLWYKQSNPGAPWQQNYYGIGYRSVLLNKVPRKEDFSDNSLLDWQVRTWVHMEAGDLQLNGATWQSVGGSFFRVGPSVQAVLNFPELLNGFSVDGEYDYLPAISGPTGRNHYVSLGAALTLYHNALSHRKISLVANYKEGGLALSKQPVEIVTVGLGVTF